MMQIKHICGCFLVLTSLLSCDDGDIVFQDISFENNNLVSCNNGFPNFYVFNIQDNQAYILTIQETNFRNQQNINAPLQIPLGNQASLILRTYNREISNSDICTTIPPANLSVTSERIAQSGIVEITTRAVRSAPDANNATRLTGYRHQVNIKNLTLGFDGQFQLIDDLLLGFYNTGSTTFVNFNATNIQSCNDNNLKFKIIQNQALELLVPPALFANVVTPVGSPRTALIDADHRLRYLVFPDFVNQGNFCGTNILNPSQIWMAQTGVANDSGIIEVSTVQDTDPNTAQTIFKHQVIFRNVRFVRNSDAVDFLLGNVYDFGEVITQ